MSAWIWSREISEVCLLFFRQLRRLISLKQLISCEGKTIREVPTQYLVILTCAYEVSSVCASCVLGGDSLNSTMFSHSERNSSQISLRQRNATSCVTWPVGYVQRNMSDVNKATYVPVCLCSVTEVWIEPKFMVLRSALRGSLSIKHELPYPRTARNVARLISRIKPQFSCALSSRTFTFSSNYIYRRRLI